MTDFDLLDELPEEAEDEKSKALLYTNCLHLNTTHDKDKDQDICVECGELLVSKSFRSDIKFISDPNRIQSRKIEERTIFGDVDSMGFNEDIVLDANRMYLRATNGKIYRGNTRKSIVFACIFYAFKSQGKPQSYSKLITLFQLSKKIGSRGIKHVNLYTDIKTTTNITPITLISEIMIKFNATPEQTAEVTKLYEQVKNRSSKLNGCRPQSLASSLVYFWIIKNNKNITMKDFIKMVSLSEITIHKTMKEIELVLS